VSDRQTNEAEAPIEQAGNRCIGVLFLRLDIDDEFGPRQRAQFQTGAQGDNRSASLARPKS
jgi:hypothetical protein